MEQGSFRLEREDPFIIAETTKNPSLVAHPFLSHFDVAPGVGGALRRVGGVLVRLANRR